MELVQGELGISAKSPLFSPSTLTVRGMTPMYFGSVVYRAGHPWRAAIISHQVMDRGPGWWFYRVLGFGGPTDLLEPLLDEIFEVAAAQRCLRLRPAIQLTGNVVGGPHRGNCTN